MWQIGQLMLKVAILTSITFGGPGVCVLVCCYDKREGSGAKARSLYAPRFAPIQAIGAALRFADDIPGASNANYVVPEVWLFPVTATERPLLLGRPFARPIDHYRP